MPKLQATTVDQNWASLIRDILIEVNPYGKIEPISTPIMLDSEELAAALDNT